MSTPDTAATYTPLYSGPRIVTRHPYEAMPPRVAALWDHYTRKLGWDASIHSRMTFDFLVDSMEFSRGKPVLDAGAGHQRYRPFYDESIYLSQEHPAGIEFKRMQGIEYDLVCPIDERIPLKDGSLACIVSTSVLEHVRHPEAFLAEAHRVLHPGGRIYIHVPFAYCEHEQPYDFQRPTRYGLQAWLEAAGFRQHSVLPSSNATYGASWYLLNALRAELSARGAAQRFADLAPIVKYALDTTNAITDDYIDPETLMPVGWIAVAQKDGALGEFPTWDKARWLQEIRG